MTCLHPNPVPLVNDPKKGKGVLACPDCHDRLGACVNFKEYATWYFKKGRFDACGVIRKSNELNPNPHPWNYNPVNPIKSPHKRNLLMQHT